MSEKITLEFESFKDKDCTSSLNGKWKSENNPISIDKEQSNQYNSVEPIGGVSNTTYIGQKPDKLTIQLNIDEKDVYNDLSSSEFKNILNSGEFPDANSAENQIKSLKDVIWKYHGSEHKPPYVKIIYGDELFKGICIEFSEKKIKVSREGKLLVAELSLKFESTISPELAKKKAGNQSPDMTHYYTVKEGETLPIISNNIYGTTQLYIALAKFNKLNSPRSLKAGQKIILPPLIK